jgi:hypothetical protein
VGAIASRNEFRPIANVLALLLCCDGNGVLMWVGGWIGVNFDVRNRDAIFEVPIAVSLDISNKDPIQSRLVQYHVRLPGQSFSDICCPSGSYDFPSTIFISIHNPIAMLFRLIYRPEANLIDPIRISNQILAQAERLEHLDSTTLHAICLSYL